MRSFAKIVCFSAAFGLFHTDAQAQSLMEKANKQYELHNYKVAAQSFEALLGSNNSGDIIVRLIDCYVHTNDWNNAAKWSQMALNNGQLPSEGYLQYGRILMQLGRYDEAETVFNTYRKANENVAMRFLKAVAFARSSEGDDSRYKSSAWSSINSNKADFGIGVYKNMLIWSSDRTDKVRERSNGSDKADWRGATPHHFFTAPIAGTANKPFKISFLKSDLKAVANESHASFSADGKKVAFMRSNFGNGERWMANGGLDMSIYLADVDENGNWLNIKPFPFNGSGAAVGFPALSPDGNTLFFASDRNIGSGGFDLYSSQKRGTGWTEPRNLGSQINTAGDEITPFFDGKDLYFASDWHTGYGGYDIFKTQLDVGAAVVNLGARVNSAADDLGLVWFEKSKKGAFVSNRAGTKGGLDVFMVEQEIDGVELIVQDAKTGKPMPDAKVVLSKGHADNLLALGNGKWLVDLSDNQQITATVSRAEYDTQNIPIEPNFKPSQRIIEVNMTPGVPTAYTTKAVTNSNEYAGLVTDGSTGEPMEGVMVKITNQAAEKTEVLYTDARGRFKTALTANVPYLITFSREGFVDSRKPVKVTPTKGRFLGETVLAPSGLSAREVVIDTDNGTSQKLVADNKEPNKMIPTDVPTNYNTKVVTKKAVSTVNYAGPTVYAVQLLVSGKEDVINMSAFRNMSQWGNIYVVTEKDMQKVRIGIFKTREEAVACLKNIQGLDYSDAFIVEEKNQKAVDTNMFETKKVPSSYNTKTVTNKPVISDKSIAQNINGSMPIKEPAVPVVDNAFKVRIASMTKPEWFDYSKINGFGKVQTMKKGKFTVFFIDGFESLQEASSIKKKIQAAGYADARVVVNEKGDFKVVD